MSTCASLLLFLIWQFILWISIGCFFSKDCKMIKRHWQRKLHTAAGREAKLFCLRSNFPLSTGQFGVQIINSRARTECQASFPKLKQILNICSSHIWCLRGVGALTQQRESFTVLFCLQIWQFKAQYFVLLQIFQCLFNRELLLTDNLCSKT